MMSIASDILKILFQACLYRRHVCADSAMGVGQKGREDSLQEENMIVKNKDNATPFGS